MINAEVTKNNNENNVNLLRRFTKKVQGSGVLPRVRSIRYSLRKPSEYVKKKKTLKVLAKKTIREDMIKMGKLVENTRGKR
jgi:ribosomal protein S21